MALGTRFLLRGVRRMDGTAVDELAASPFEDPTASRTYSTAAAGSCRMFALDCLRGGVGRTGESPCSLVDRSCISRNRIDLLFGAFCRTRKSSRRHSTIDSKCERTIIQAPDCGFNPHS